ncbi:uncharacterized protein BDR25DRAFT_319362 [Lindgomyces ingoldianus]|uniref:Uncharacterized protein n=1 Tax=Lindgomyces ingoldianus TaxID=673940 RepID=A0ACB6QB91_9PLEO|nr:uncharacterized protein BDR25DRAFT_319362 [Lindgomyces ingoldianus]KAF2464309.1 hypothetical protein BDR25DRAFT_319362 [Lindgomyces ingoldianus]
MGPSTSATVKSPTIASPTAAHSHPSQNSGLLALVPPKSAFIDFQPLHIVLEFQSAIDAMAFHGSCHGSIIKPMHPTWIYLPMPHGLKRVRRTERGDIAFLFESRQLAEMWEHSLLGVARLGASEDREANGESKDGLGIRARAMSLGHVARDTAKTVFVGETRKN